MITLKPCADREKIQALFSENGLTASADAGCVMAAQGEETLGVCLYRLLDDTMEIALLTPTDNLTLADGLLRSTLHVGFEHGAKVFSYCETAPEELFRRLGFLKSGERRLLDGDKLYGGCGK